MGPGCQVPGYLLVKGMLSMGIDTHKLGNSTIGTDITKLSICSLAGMIRRDWKSKGKGVSYAAEPYLSAMETLSKIEEHYGMDSGVSVVSYFLSNASGWRGEVAKEIKSELRRRVKEHG